MDKETKIVEHLKLIQGIITRMSVSSFNIKGFTLIVFSGLIAYGLTENMVIIFCVVYLILLMLSLLDCFYLWQEKKYRKLYDTRRKAKTTDFSMDTSSFNTKVKFRSALKSIAIWPFYITLLILNSILLIIVWC
ncbi:MAG TPA: hypothetical protein PK624_09025 [Spirochaetota bacterium]|nr:hypothetical protein [Spirochaetota bacterium]HOR44924.1 hypothetical protein [Spirochaetota bacterium]HPK56479.1 hypothetical protein [Spirochaetota bacterium]